LYVLEIVNCGILIFVDPFFTIFSVKNSFSDDWPRELSLPILNLISRSSPSHSSSFGISLWKIIISLFCDSCLLVTAFGLVKARCSGL